MTDSLKKEIRNLERKLIEQKIQHEEHLPDLVFIPNPTFTQATLKLMQLDYENVEHQTKQLREQIADAEKILKEVCNSTRPGGFDITRAYWDKWKNK